MLDLINIKTNSKNDALVRFGMNYDRFVLWRERERRMVRDF